VGPSGEPILLLEQDRGKWDHLLIGRGLAALERTEALGGALGNLRAASRYRRVSRPARERPKKQTGNASPRCTMRSHN